MQKVQRYVDTVNLMTYDYYEPGSESITGNHSPLYADPADPKAASSADTVRAFEKAGVPAEKILLGVPFYGHEWGQVKDQNHGLFQVGKPVPGAYTPFNVIDTTMLASRLHPLLGRRRKSPLPLQSGAANLRFLRRPRISQAQVPVHPHSETRRHHVLGILRRLQRQTPPNHQHRTPQTLSPARATLSFRCSPSLKLVSQRTSCHSERTGPRRFLRPELRNTSVALFAGESGR